MTGLGDALAEPNGIDALVVYNCNPAVVCPDTNAVTKGLARDDLFTVVLELMPTDTMRYADVVFPATTQLEHLDVLWSWGHYYLSLNRPAIPPRGDTRPNTEIFRALATAMGYDEPELHEDDETLLETYLADITTEQRAALDEHGYVKMPVVTAPDARVQLRSDVLAEIAGIDPLPQGEDAPEDADGLILITPKSHHFLNSQLVNHERLRKAAGARARPARTGGCERGGHSRRRADGAQQRARHAGARRVGLRRGARGHGRGARQLVAPRRPARPGRQRAHRSGAKRISVRRRCSPPACRSARWRGSAAARPRSSASGCFPKSTDRALVAERDGHHVRLHRVADAGHDLGRARAATGIASRSMPRPMPMSHERRSTIAASASSGGNVASAHFMKPPRHGASVNGGGLTSSRVRVLPTASCHSSVSSPSGHSRGVTVHVVRRRELDVVLARLGAAHGVGDAQPGEVELVRAVHAADR